MIKFDFKTYTEKYVNDSEINSYLGRKEEIKLKINNAFMNGWLNPNIDEETYQDIINTSTYVKENFDLLVVIGIGGSFMGTKSIYEMYKPYFKNNYEIVFAGTDLSSKYLNELLEYMSNRNVCVNVISKSGITLEPQIAFDIIYNKLKEKYDENELKRRIIITTDKESGSLRELVNEKGYKSFVIPNNIGGRYSVFTPVALLPLSICGMDIKEFTNINDSFEQAYMYATIRNILYYKGKKVENFAIYEKNISYFVEWLKQLFGETEGKDNKGILPISTINTRDLHSLGQYIQEGSDIIFETVININSNYDISFKEKSLKDINNLMINSVAKAHYDGHTPSIHISLDDSINSIGNIMYFFMLSAAISGYLLDIDPFNQPGVEIYKNNLKESIKL